MCGIPLEPHSPLQPSLHAWGVPCTVLLSHPSPSAYYVYHCAAPTAPTSPHPSFSLLSWALDRIETRNKQINKTKGFHWDKSARVRGPPASVWKCHGSPLDSIPHLGHPPPFPTPLHCPAQALSPFQATVKHSNATTKRWCSVRHKRLYSTAVR